MKIHPLLALASLVVMLALPARASLVWENPEVELHPTISDKTAVAHFKYKNTGDQPVKIKAVQPSCGCTTAAPPAEPVAPGASGEIVATFNIGDRFGEQTKTIRVSTDDPKNEGTVLKLKANIPRLLEITPAFVYWRRGEERTAKTIDVKIGGDFPITKLDVTSTDPTVKVESAAVPNEKAFRITITPEKGNRPINAALKIQPDFPKDAPKTFYANVRVDAPAAPGGDASGPVAGPRGPVAFGPNGPIANPVRAVPEPSAAASATPPK